MNSPIIRVENLTKEYRLGAAATNKRSYATLRESIANAVRAPFRRVSRRSKDNAPPFRALEDVSFEIRQGEVLGIIGRNGAGKSTLLKVLSRIVEPTAGRVSLRGRVASLLEVGTGFHPELTGRENIFLNGVILGMARAEIARRFDEIVAFAGVEKFLDTPVKHYSSGMYVRLAFAVAAHLDPEILIVDEVLAVGDAEFQRKCLGKMQDVATGEGRTVLFVSHNMSAVSRLCSRGIYLDGGKVCLDSTIDSVIGAYQRSAKQGGVALARDPSKPHIASVSVDPAALARGDLIVNVGFSSPTVLPSVTVGMVVRNPSGSPMFGFDTNMSGEFRPGPARSGTMSISVPSLQLYSGLYSVSIWFGDGVQSLDRALDVLSFDFVSPYSLPGGVSTDWVGHMRVVGEWNLAIDSE